MPNRPGDRFELPQHLIDDIDDIEDKYLAGAVVQDIEKAIIDAEAEDELVIMKRGKIVELLKMIREHSAGSSDEDEAITVVALELLREMGCPIDMLDHIFGMGFDPELFTEQLLIESEEADTEQDV